MRWKLNGFICGKKSRVNADDLIHKSAMASPDAVRYIERNTGITVTVYWCGESNLKAWRNVFLYKKTSIYIWIHLLQYSICNIIYIYIYIHNPYITQTYLRRYVTMYDSRNTRTNLQTNKMAISLSVWLIIKMLPCNFLILCQNFSEFSLSGHQYRITRYRSQKANQPITNTTMGCRPPDFYRTLFA